MRTSLIRAVAAVAVALGAGLGVTSCGESDEDDPLARARHKPHENDPNAVLGIRGAATASGPSGVRHDANGEVVDSRGPVGSLPRPCRTSVSNRINQESNQETCLVEAETAGRDGGSTSRNSS
jgi:hypothetical protein